MSTKFRRRVGAAADLKELEYVSALHQTCSPYLREDATVSSLDVVRFLKSRAGLIVSKEDGKRIVKGLGGGRVDQSVIDDILKLSENSSLELLQKQQEERNIMDKLRLASSLGALRKKLLHKKKQEEEEAADKKEDELDMEPVEEYAQTLSIQDSKASIKASTKDEAKASMKASTSTSLKQLDESNVDSPVSPGDDDSDPIAQASLLKDPKASMKASTSTSLSEQPEGDTPPDVENPSTDNDDDDDTEIYLDLVQIMAILLMPTLARAGQEWHEAQLPPPPVEEPPPPPVYQGIKGKVLKVYDEYKTRQHDKHVAFEESLKPSPENLIPNVLETLLKSVHCNTSEPPVMNAALVKKLLFLHGECERASDNVLVDKMVEAATMSSGVLDEEAFVQALTYDLSEWTIGAEDANTTSFYDVWGFSNYYEKALLEIEQEQQAQEAAEAAANAENAHDSAADEEEPIKIQDEGFHLPKVLSNDFIKHAFSHEKGHAVVKETGEEVSFDDFKKVALLDEKEGSEVFVSALEAPVQSDNEGTSSGDEFMSVIMDAEDAAFSLVKEAGAEGVNLAKEAGTGGAKVVMGAGAEGVNLAKQAGTDGVKVIKGAQKGGAMELQAEKKAMADRPVVKFLTKHFGKADKDSRIPDLADKNRVETGMEARQDEVYQHHKSSASTNTEASGGQASTNGEQSSAYEIKEIRSAFAIDSAVDIYSSSLLMVAIFVFFICTSLVYAVLFHQMTIFDPDCGDNFLCLLVDKIILWAIFAVFLALTGYFVIIPLSTGNSPVERSPFGQFIAFVIALVLTWMPYAAVETYREQRVTRPYDRPAMTVTKDDYRGAQTVTYVVGCIVAGLIAYQFVLAVIGNRRIGEAKWANWFLLTSFARGSGRSKRAATRKINRLLQNASSMKPKTSDALEDYSVDTSEAIMINFVIRGEMFEDCGGLIWTWKQLYSGDLFEEEGVWIMSRLLVIQMIQALFISFKSYAYVLFIEGALQRCQKWQDDLRPGYPRWVYDFVPSPREARIAFWPAFSVAVIVMVSIFFIYLPSYVRRVIEYRCGMIPSLHTTYFAKYRKSVDLVYTNIGNALYALFGASLLFFFLVSFIIFLFVWPSTKHFMILLLAWGLGLCITICIKHTLQVCWRKRFYAGFYRTNPRKACLTQLALECYYIGLGGGVLVTRFFEFILAACFYVGRTDVPFLSNDVSIGGYIFDYAPQSFVKDILVHEAHRHPYLERLFAMYMMKLKSDSFCSEAGACWRQLFVASLMPWLVRQRVFSDERLGAKLEEYNTRRKEGQSPLQLKHHAEMAEEDSDES